MPISVLSNSAPIKISPSPWYVYIVRCGDNSFYTGLTNNIRRRLNQHNTNRGAAYTKGRGPITLIHLEPFATHQEAARREIAIKKLTRAQKEQLVE